MKILVACEFSGIVRDAFLAKGHDAISCDLEPTERPGPHYQGDLREILYEGWDMLVAFPPCTYLCAMGSNWWYRQPWRLEEQQKALAFVRLLLEAPIEKIALENPVGVISTFIRKPDQYIQPHWFGHVERKKTGLWLKNLPPLLASWEVVNPQEFCKRMDNTKDYAKNKSRTFPGVARAMAEQWS